MADGDFKTVKRSKQTEGEKQRRRAWVKFREAILPQIGKEYVAKEVETWIASHPDHDRTKAENWAQTNWKRILKNGGVKLEALITEIDSRAASGAWKLHDIDAFDLPGEETTVVVAPAKSDSKAVGFVWADEPDDEEEEPPVVKSPAKKLTQEPPVVKSPAKKVTQQRNGRQQRQAPSSNPEMAVTGGAFDLLSTDE